MSRRQVIVDGSNLATEGRSLPSLEQLDQAVREFIGENPDDQVTVVVDASFGHRIDPRELPTFEEAEAAGDVVYPPAGAIGRGDAFLLRIAQKTGATVLSNDSFQEFHAEHPWLFDKGRLVGGKPVPGVGWIFMERTPVRGPKSREVVKEARRRKDTTTAAASPSAGTETPVAGEPAVRGERRSKLSAAPKQRSKSVDRAIETATHEVVDPSTAGSRRRSRPAAEPVNEPLAFISFIASHPLGSLVEAVVFEYSSHGAFVEADGARCYVPLSAMGDPAPRSAREVMGKGEVVSLVVQALDPQRRGIELAMPGHEHVSGAPTPETVEAETLDELPGVGGPALPRRSARRRSAVSDAEDTSPGPVAATPEAPEAESAPAKRAPAKRAPAKRAPAGKAAARSDEDSAAEATVPSARPAKAPARVAKSSQALDEAEFGEAGPSETAPTKRAPRATKTAAAPPAAKAAQATKAPRSAKETVKVAPATKTAATKTAATVRRSAATSAAKSATASKAVASAKAVKAVAAVKAVKVAAAVKAAASGPAAKKAAGSVAKKATGSATKTAKTVKPVEPAARATKPRAAARKTPAGS